MACYFIVHHHGGKIEARSQDGQGTHFTLRIPLHPERAPLLRDDQDLMKKAFLNETIWEKLITT